MKIIFAQGNVGKEYLNTRHNIGFIFINNLAKDYGIEFQNNPKFKAEIAETTINNEKVLLVKPTTFYNLTGESARSIIDFYKIDQTQDFVVVYDDIALPFGVIRTREKGGDAGNNGIKSLNSSIGENHKRIRVGTHTELCDKIDTSDYVLSKFNSEEKKKLDKIYQNVKIFIDQFLTNNFIATKVTTE